MPEEILCLSGKFPKIFTYLDQKNQRYIHSIYKLNDKITEYDLRNFFNQIYNIKLDNSYAKIFNENCSTRDFINCLKNILKEERVIDLTPIYELLNKEEDANWEPVIQIMNNFFKMFDISSVSYQMYEYDGIIRYVESHPSFNQGDTNFNKEELALPYNSLIMDSLNLNSTIKNSYKKKIRAINSYKKAV